MGIGPQEHVIFAWMRSWIYGDANWRGSNNTSAHNQWALKIATGITLEIEKNSSCCYIWNLWNDDMVLAIVAGSRCGRHIHNPTNQLIAYVGCICQILVGFKVKNKKVPLARRRFKSKDPFKPMRNYHVGMRATWNEHLERHRSHSVHRSRPCRRFLDDLRTILHQALVGLS